MRRLTTALLAISAFLALSPAAAHASSRGWLTYRAPERAVDDTLPAELLPYSRVAPASVDGYGDVDATGVRVLVRGGTAWDHPHAQAYYGINLLESYRLSGDSRHLELAERQAARLVARHVDSRGAWFHPYPFDYLGPGHVPHAAPWYSAIAQGSALSLFSRLAAVTHDPAYREAADRTFESFTLPARPGSPWVSWTTGDGQLWLEEYPNQAGIGGARVFNGHVFAIYGVYDYLRLTGSPAARTVLRGAITTAQEVADGLRRTSWQSQYCVSFVGDAHGYHGIHVTQLAQLAALTGDQAFNRLADAFQADYVAPTGPGTVLMAPGTVTGYRFAADGSVASRRTATYSRTTSAPASSRTRIKGLPGYWFTVTAGTFAGYAVQEVPGRVWQRGRVEWLPYRLDRTLTFSAGGVVTSAFDQAWNEARHTSSYTKGSTEQVDGRARINGKDYLRLGGGPAAGEWVPVAAGALG